MPSVVTAQATPEVGAAADTLERFLPTREELGDGWIVVNADDFVMEDTDTDGYRSLYTGPEGARLRIYVYDLPLRLSERVKVWNALAEIWQSWAGYYAAPAVAADERPYINGETSQPYPALPSINDSLRSIGTEPGWNLPAGVGLYALEDGPAVLIILEGTLQERTQYRAIDYLAGLIAGH